MSWFKKKRPQVTYLEEWEMDTILGHFNHYMGDSPIHFHDGIEDPVHVDLGHVPLHREFGCQAFFTFGMSALPIPDAHNDEAYVELYMLLPADWPHVTAESKSEVTWPLHWLRVMAKKPFWAGKPVEPGSMIYFDDPIIGTHFRAFMYLPALLHPPEFSQLKMGDKLVNIWMVIPLTAKEHARAGELDHPLDILELVLGGSFESQRALDFLIVTPNRDDYTLSAPVVE